PRKALLAIWRMGLTWRAAKGDLKVDESAAEQASDPNLLRPIFDYRVVRGFLERPEPGVYRLTERGANAVPYCGYLSTMVGAYEPVFSHLEDVVRGRLVYGEDVLGPTQATVRGVARLEAG